MSASQSAPRRIQRKRTKGWKMEPGTTYVGRGSRWGNPFPLPEFPAEEAVRCFRIYAESTTRLDSDWQKPLRGRDLACWCASRPYHADVLLEMCASKQCSSALFETCGRVKRQADFGF